MYMFVYVCVCVCVPGECVPLVQVEDSPMFDRDGFDIHSDIHVSFTQAILGGEVRTTGLSGPIVVKVGPLWSLLAH